MSDLWAVVMDLSDAALRELALEVLRACSLTPQGDSTPSVTDRVEVCVSDLLSAGDAACVLTHDAARAEQRETIKGLLKACDELMTEFVSKRRAANWGVINDAMVAGGKALRPGITP